MSQAERGMDGSGSGSASARMRTVSESQVKVANPKNIRSHDFLLRLVAIGTTVAAAFVMGLAKEDKIVQVQLKPDSLPVSLLVPVRTRYSSALLYFVVVNAIACAYAAVSLLATIGSQRGPEAVTLAITILDVIMVGLLFSGNGAGGAIGVLGARGNSHMLWRWNRLCTRFEKFCRSLRVALALSSIGSLVFVLLAIFSIINLHRRLQ